MLDTTYLPMACASLMAMTNSSPGENPACPKLEYMPRMALPTRAAPRSVTVRRNQPAGWEEEEEGNAVVVVGAGANSVLVVVDDAVVAIVLVVLVLVPLLLLAVVAKLSPALLGVIKGTTTRLVGDAPGSTANDTMPLTLSSSSFFWTPATRRKSNSTKTADGCVSRTNCAANCADDDEMCAVPNKYTRRLPRRQTLTVASHVADDVTAAGGVVGAVAALVVVAASADWERQAASAAAVATPTMAIDDELAKKPRRVAVVAAAEPESFVGSTETAEASSSSSWFEENDDDDELDDDASLHWWLLPTMECRSVCA